MRIIYFLRGIPASGKSFWLQQHKLTPYTICADEIRLLYAAPILNNDGQFSISQNHDKRVWHQLLSLLEERMARGEFIIVDATHYRESSLKEYKKLINEYRYRPFIVDFSDVSLETALQRNKEREEYKRVPEEVIIKMHRVLTMNANNSAVYPILSPADAVEQINKSLIFDYNHYEKVVVFGDIHGCFSPLNEYFQDNPFNDNTAYIFCGDYVDRGIQHEETFELLLSIYDKKNVLCLEGNHEKWLRLYAENTVQSLDKIRSRTFKEKTAPQLEKFHKKDLRMFCRSLGQMAYIAFGDKEYFISHGGIGRLPHLFVNSFQYIHGVGAYEDTEDLYNAWEKNTLNNAVLIHGHRNIANIPAKARERCYNLCSEVEFGSDLRILEITKQNGIACETIKEYHNPIYDKNLPRIREVLSNNKNNILPKTENELLQQLNASKLIQKKCFDNGIVSYNFTRTAFYKNEWNDLTCTARGLFVHNDKVVCRSYNKFFNWDEMPETKDRTLAKKLVFPVAAYKKENGFLAMVSHFNEELLVCSKSTIAGEYVDYIRLALDNLSDEVKSKIIQFCQKENVTFVFECINIENDPHIVKYENNHLYLLDIVRNDFVFDKVSYEKLQEIAKQFCLECKKLSYKFNSWEELYAFKKDLDKTLNPNSKDWDEGLVFEDANGFMVKYKNPNYRFWKRLRSLLERIQNDKELKLSDIDENMQDIVDMMYSLKKENKISNLNILDIQKKYWCGLKNE
ncbi:MAG: metallophosphoesterase [Neisseriaceae bacterium]|nr:metallophosphoesterase [Neisseriaceae bacterium]